MPGHHKEGASQYFPAALQPCNFNVAGCNHGDVNLQDPCPLNPTSYSSNLQLLLHLNNSTNYKKNHLQTGIVKPSLFSRLPQNWTLSILNCFLLDLMHLVSLNIPNLLLICGVEHSIMVTEEPNLFMCNLSQLLGIKVAALMAYHPQTNGQTEQVNQEVEQFL